MFKMSMEDLLRLLNEGRKNPIGREEVETDKIKLSLLKKIDEVFRKGINYYIDPRTPSKTLESSIFFRKEKFNADLNLGSKKIVTQFEEFKNNFTAIAKLSEVKLSRKVPVFSTSHNPQKVAGSVNVFFYPGFHAGKREFLKSLINKLGSADILVAEFVETWNKREKANIDGFFLAPNVIVLKRQQNALRREIFTLAHELGHYLLNEEEVESVDFANMYGHKSSLIENWCNDFAFYFLAGKYADLINNLDMANASNDYHMELIAEISGKTHLSRLALYTRLLMNHKISYAAYQQIKLDFEEQFRLKEVLTKNQREQDRLAGVESSGRAPKPIQSPLLVSTLQTAFYEGVINEFDFCKTLNISAEKIHQYIQ